MRTRVAAKAKNLFLVPLMAAIVFRLLSGTCSAVYPPCPAVLDTTIAQMAAEWVTSYTKPYCAILEDRRNMLLNHIVKPGIFHPSSGASQIFMYRSTSENFARYADKALRHTNHNTVSATEGAIAKLRVLKSGVALAVYTTGKKSFMASQRVDRVIQGFAPTLFDFASSRQVQKDAAKLAHLRGLIQAQELKIISLTKMLGSLKEGR